MGCGSSKSPSKHEHGNDIDLNTIDNADHTDGLPPEDRTIIAPLPRNPVPSVLRVSESGVIGNTSGASGAASIMFRSKSASPSTIIATKVAPGRKAVGGSIPGMPSTPDDSSTDAANSTSIVAVPPANNNKPPETVDGPFRLSKPIGVHAQLIEASRQRNIARVVLCLERGASVYIRDEVGETPLYHAISSKYTPAVNDVVQLLLEHNADVNAQNMYGETPLHGAAAFGLFAVAEMLLNTGANPNSVNKDSRSPLFYASAVGHADIARLLLLNGANVAGTSLRLPDSWDRRTALHEACKYGRVKNVSILLEFGADVNCVETKTGFTPLLEACQQNSIDVVRLLRDRNANVNCFTTLGRTPLHCAAFRGNAPVVSMLLSAGAQVDIPDSVGSTALHEACHFGRTNVVALLLDAGSNINAIDSNMEYSPLHWAAVFGHLETARFLIKMGARIDIKARGNVTPARLAAENGHQAVVRLFEQSIQSISWEPKHTVN